MAESTQQNREYYEAESAGRLDYWTYMAAPRFRVATLVELVEQHRPRSIVDLGCGNGALLGELAESPGQRRLVGIDLSTSQIEHNKERRPSMEWFAADLSQPDSLPSALLGAFDCVIASEIIEHLDQPEALLSSASALADTHHGRLLISTQSGPLRETERRVGHVRHFDRDSVTTLLRHSGWTPMRVWNAGFPFHDASKWYANLRPDSSMDQFGDKPYGKRERIICWALRQAFRLNSKRRGAQLFAVAKRQKGAGSSESDSPPPAAA